MKSLPLTLCTSMLLALLPVGSSLADDGPIFRRDISKTPDLETAHAAMRMLPLYVPAQLSTGELDPDGIEYYNDEATPQLIETRFEARPLIAHYTDGHVEGIDEEGYGGFPGHGNRDAFAAVSLDDGTTWQRTNLSKSGDQSSIRIKLGGRQKIDYPGDVGRSFMAADGNKVLVIWVSRYARGGNPTYAIDPLLEEYSNLAARLQERGTIADAEDCTDGDQATPCLYLEDHFGVAGSQGLSDLADEGLPLIGELPYAAVWVARGVILPPAQTDLETSRFVWFKAERLTSAVRDANRPEAACVKGAGCVVTWQEDPDGIRPGHGDGPGEGWSGAIAHHQTDTWYSYIDWDDFGLVADDTQDPVTYGSLFAGTGDLADWVKTEGNESGTPQAAIPMAIPVRLTDNSMCTALDGADINLISDPYCHIDFDGNGTADFCDHTVTVEVITPTEPLGTTIEMCVTEDGRLMRGNTASTRPRLGLHGYSTDGDVREGAPVNSAWFYMAYEENKGLGDDVCDDGDCTDEETSELDKRDMGKNVWYHTFDMFTPELVSQGLMLNQPAVYYDGFVDPNNLIEAAPLNDINLWAFIEDPIYAGQAGITTTTLYQTEIARRASPISQDWYDAGDTRTVALQLWKQGIVRRGGPADIFGRRFVIPEGTGETGPDTYELCTTNEECTITYDYCTTSECTPNPEYDYNYGQCKKDPYQSRCLPYLDDNGVPTDECDDAPVCYYDQLECPTGATCTSEETCEDVTTCESVDDCDGTYDDNQVCNEIPGQVDGFDPTTDNPYDYANMECLDFNGDPAWYFTNTNDDGTAENPRYVKGLCAAPAINLSGNTVIEGEECTGAEACFLEFPFSDYFDDLVGGDLDDDPTTDDSIQKIYTWEQYGPAYGLTATDTAETNFDDTSWENPYDVAKGHRGFMTGDMVMVMYAWQMNWKALTDAHAPFNLYNRRSFDGGKTWTTLPGGWTHTNEIPYSGNGTTTCEFMYDSTAQDDMAVCNTYAAGDFERARNVSQLLGSQVTVLDPRYAPTSRSITEESVSTDSLPSGFMAPLYDDDVRDPSRYFMVYETGHTAAYDEGEAEPLDLFYSRAVEWGDQYLVWQDEDSYEGECLPSADTEDDFDLTGFCNEFDALEGHHYLESGEAAVAASPGGQFFYSVWNEGVLEAEEVVASDATFRRVLFLDEYEPPLE